MKVSEFDYYSSCWLDSPEISRYHKMLGSEAGYSHKLYANHCPMSALIPTQYPDKTLLHTFAQYQVSFLCSVKVPCDIIIKVQNLYF